MESKNERKSKNENGGLGARKGSFETDTVDVASLLLDDDEVPSGSGQWWGRSTRTPLPLFPANATLHTAPQYIPKRFPRKELSTLNRSTARQSDLQKDKLKYIKIAKHYNDNLNMKKDLVAHSEVRTHASFDNGVSEEFLKTIALDHSAI